MNMKFKVSELFYSIQGEGRYVGTPSVFLRLFGCNFTCGGFGMPRGEISQERFAIDPKSVTKYSDLPLVKTGCDSYASWDPKFKHLSKHFTVSELADEIKAVLGGRTFNRKTHLVITGGEPLLGWQKLYPDLLTYLEEKLELAHVTFETNGTQRLQKSLFEYIANSYIEFTFSVSPKLSISGHTFDEACVPDALWDYNDAITKSRFKNDTAGEVYTKYVVDCESDMLELHKFNLAYTKEYNTTIGNQNYKDYFPANNDTYLMPVGGTIDGYLVNNKHVAELALKYGYKYSPRLHVDLWKNAWGT